jgi:hypothetical protein
MPTREELANHLLLSYVLTYNDRVLRALVENPAAVLERLGLPADAMRCPPGAHRALARADAAVREVEALGDLDPVQSMPIVAEIVSRHFASPHRLVKIPFGVQFEESQTPEGEEPGEPAEMTWTATGTVQCTWGLKCGSDTDG